MKENYKHQNCLKGMRNGETPLQPPGFCFSESVCVYMHEQLLLCRSKRGLIYRRKVVPCVIGHSKTAQRGAFPLEVSWSQQWSQILYLTSLVESNLYGLPDSNIPTWMESDLMCLKKKRKKKVCEIRVYYAWVISPIFRITFVPSLCVGWG